MTKQVHRSANTTHVIQGEYATSGDSEEMLTTILGSCICTCLFDPIAKIGGMNHFLIGDAPTKNSVDLKYGLHAMELIINDLLKLGARRIHLEAKLFGGASMLDGLTDIGAKNAEFAIDFLSKEKIPLSGKSLGGKSARRIRFWPTTGRTQQLLIQNSVIVRKQEVQYFSSRSKETAFGSVELF